MSKNLNDFPAGSTVSFKAGPTQVTRSGTVERHEGQFLVVNIGDGKTIKTRPGAVLS